MRGAATLALVVGVMGWPREAPRAQGFGFLFGQTERDDGGYRARRSRPRIAAVPLPVPRPHFPEDEPRTEGPERAMATPPPAVSVPIGGAGATTLEPRPKTPTDPTFPPLPPEKPAALVAPPDAKPQEIKPQEIKPAEAKPAEAEQTKAPDSTATRSPKVDGPKVDTPKPPGPEPIETKGAPLPTIAPSGATNAFNPRQPAGDATCPGRLQATRVEAASVSLGPQPDPRCVVQQPVKLDHLVLPDGTRISFPDRPTLACVTADTFATYVRDLLVPLAKGSYGIGVESVWTGPGLECRSRDHVFGAKLSAHGQGLAIDIAQLKLGDGRMLAVGDPKSDRDQAFESAARAAGCGYFHTVLGPGSDSYHRTHWHFDLEERGSKGDSKFCK